MCRERQEALAKKLLAAKKLNDILRPGVELVGFTQVRESIKSGNKLELAEKIINQYEADLRALNAERKRVPAHHPDYKCLLPVPEEDTQFRFRGLSEEGKSRMLRRHNSFRARFQKYDNTVHTLTWSDELTERAQMWAEHLVFNVNLDHSIPPYGNILKKVSYETKENIFYAGPTPPPADPEEPVNSWFSEYKLVSYKEKNPSSKTGHFWAVVMRTATQVGGGMAAPCEGLRGREAWVCQYRFGWDAGLGVDLLYVDWNKIIPDAWTEIRKLNEFQ
jgi:hypothetical protein